MVKFTHAHIYRYITDHFFPQSSCRLPWENMLIYECIGGKRYPPFSLLAPSQRPMGLSMCLWLCRCVEELVVLVTFMQMHPLDTLLNLWIRLAFLHIRIKKHIYLNYFKFLASDIIWFVYHRLKQRKTDDV